MTPPPIRGKISLVPRTHRFANKHPQRAHVHKESVRHHLRHLAVHDLAAEGLPDHRAVRDRVHGHSGSRHDFGLTNLLDSDDAHDHHRACVGSFFLFVEQLADRVWRLGAEVGGVQRDALFHFVDEEHDGQVREAQRAPVRFWRVLELSRVAKSERLGTGCEVACSVGV